jgi:hypothetical protein
MKNIRWIFALMLVALSAVACGAQAEPDASESVGEGDEALAGNLIVITNYFSDPDMNNEVGWCIRSSCPGSAGSTCSGGKSKYVTIDRNPCN